MTISTLRKSRCFALCFAPQVIVWMKRVLLSRLFFYVICDGSAHSNMKILAQSSTFLGCPTTYGHATEPTQLDVSHVFTIRRRRQFIFLPQIVLLRSRVVCTYSGAATRSSTLSPHPPPITVTYIRLPDFLTSLEQQCRNDKVKKIGK
jgi:hypothetical protein